MVFSPETDKRILHDSPTTIPLEAKEQLVINTCECQVDTKSVVVPIDLGFKILLVWNTILMGYSSPAILLTPRPCLNVDLK